MVTEVKKVSTLLFTDVVGCFNTIQDLHIRNNIVDLANSRNLTSLYNKAQKYSKYRLGGEALLTKCTVDGDAFIVLVCEEEDVFEIREINTVSIEETTMFSYNGMRFVVFSSGELPAVVNEKRRLIKAIRGARKSGIDPKVMIIFEEPKFKRYVYDIQLFKIFGVDLIVYISDKKTFFQYRRMERFNAKV